MALEYLNDNYFTLASDVWSFGVLYWEILSFGRTPYGHQSYDEVLKNLDNGYRLTCPNVVECTIPFSPEEMFKKLSHICFTADPEHRGQFSDIIQLIEKELREDEIVYYVEMKESYQKMRAENYLKLIRK